MDIKLFLSTFALIFLAEMGDKTQLAALAATAGSKSPLSVFLGASSALVLSTLAAVTVGSVMQRVLPGAYLRIGAGVLFILFGIAFILTALRRPAEAAPPHAQAAPVLTRVVLAAATEFELSASHDYRALARQTEDSEMRRLFEELAMDEESHLRAIREAVASHGESPWHQPPEQPHVSPTGPAGERLGSDPASILDQAVTHEYATADFYGQLAADAPLSGLKSLLSRLAATEREHARRLESYRNPAHSPS